MPVMLIKEATEPGFCRFQLRSLYFGSLEVMIMKRVQIEIPEDLAEALESKDPRYISQLLAVGLRQLKMEEALALIKNGDASIGYAAEFAGVHIDEMIRFAYAHGLKPDFSEETIKEELAA